ncbi:MAG: aminoacyl-tRNA hydrolase [Propionibacteriales bacterium]|nr:aminoacyl-tRNA hydrolase [Propionibacteriales bacterium]
MAGDTWVVVGLGNPGPAYADTRHNVGYRVCDLLAQRMGGSWRTHKSRRAHVVEGRLPPLPGPRLVLGRPRSYMNESGGPVAGLLQYYDAAPERLVVVHDELDLPADSVRVKFGGGDNGHNGLRSIRTSLKTGDFHRIRVGIGRPAGRQSPADYVLAPMSASDRRAMELHIERCADAVESLARNGLSATQQDYNS